MRFTGAVLQISGEKVKQDAKVPVLETITQQHERRSGNRLLNALRNQFRILRDIDQKLKIVVFGYDHRLLGLHVTIQVKDARIGDVRLETLLSKRRDIVE